MSRRGISEESFTAKKRHTIKAAKDLCYDKKYIAKLELAKNESELYRTMKTARYEKFKL